MSGIGFSEDDFDLDTEMVWDFLKRRCAEEGHEVSYRRAGTERHVCMVGDGVKTLFTTEGPSAASAVRLCGEKYVRAGHYLCNSVSGHYFTVEEEAARAEF